MNIILKDREVLINQELNEKKNFNYKDFTIFFSNGNYYLSLSKDYKFRNANRLKKLEKKQYHIVDNKNGYDVELFVYDVSKGEISFAFYNKEDFVLSIDESSLIKQRDTYLISSYLSLKDNYISTDSDYLFINSENMKESFLKNGDYVEYLGFTFIYNDSFLYMNNYLVDIKLKKIEIIEETFKYKTILPNVKNYYYPDIIALTIDNIKEFKITNNYGGLVTQLGPSFTISITMMVVAYINYLDNNNYKTLLLPILTSISTLIWPIIAYIKKNIENKKIYENTKKEYIKYLNGYYQNINNKIKTYLNSIDFYVFNHNEILNKLFYINKDNKMFLTVTPGYTKYVKPFNVELTNDNEIDEKLNKIIECINHLKNIPIFIDLKKHKNITIVGNDILYYFKLYVLMLASSYKYNDLLIAIYSSNAKLINEFYNLPHCIYENQRFLFDQQDQIHIINSVKTTKPIILFCFDKCSFKIQNDRLIKIYFSNNENDLCDDNDLLIRYYKTEGFYFDTQRHNFFFDKFDIDFSYYFQKLSLFYKYDVSNNKHLFKNDLISNDLEKNYLANHKTLKANFAYINDELLSFDLHESKQGPHGLIGGSTGSGKSELIISMLLSLCIAYPPTYLNLIIIDYKGGGIKEALSNNNKCIEHIIASCSNLENENIERLIIAIKKECDKRQKLFKELSRVSNVNIMSIDDYIQSSYISYGFETMANLLIVVDEFAELKQQQPNVIKDLISISRIGRSLGIHLILATQRPGGNIDDEIWSNARFKIALKVNNEKDSYDLIRNKDACMLNKPGEFYLCVDNTLSKCSSIYSRNNINEEFNNEVVLFNNVLQPIANKKQINRKNINELDYFVSLINRTTEKLNIKTNKIDFKINKPMSYSDLIVKYENIDKVVIGESDDYYKASKTLLGFEINQNVLLCSSRKFEINNVLNQLNNKHVQMIVIANDVYSMKYISDSILYKNKDDIDYVLETLQNEKHKELYLIIEDISIFLSYYEKHLESLFNILNRDNANIILLTFSSMINYRLINTFKNKYLINSKDKEDCYRLFNALSKYKGESFYNNDEVIPFVPAVISDVIYEDRLLKPFIPLIPEQIKYEINLLGYNIMKRNKVYKNNDELVSIVTYDNTLLNKYENLYLSGDYNFVNLNTDSLINKTFIFVGNGLERQRLVYVNNCSLLDGYGLLVRNNQKEIIRLINE